MELSESPSSAGDPHDWGLLASLLADESVYRHKMGLRRTPAGEFYAPTPAGSAIRAEKAAILGHVGKRHTLVTPDGHAAAVEFARFLGLPFATESGNDDEGRQEFNQRLGLALEPDLLLVRPPDWSLIWANVCFPTRWSLDGKSGRPLTWIHETVPSLNTELAGKIATFFSRLPPGEGWRRANWGLSASEHLNQHPDESIPILGATTTPDQVFIRVEDQHLLRLPETGSIAFGIRIANFPWTDVMNRPVLASSLLEKLRSMPTNIVHYKGLGQFISSLQ